MTNAGRAWVAAAVSVLLIGGFLAADALDDDDATGGTLAGTRWVVTEMPGVALVPDALPSVGFTATKVAGQRRLQLGWRRLHRVGAARSSCRFVVPRRLVGCAEPIKAQEEAAFVARLQAATSYAVDGDVLRLDGDQGSIVFARA